MNLSTVLNPGSATGFYSGILSFAFNQAQDWNTTNNNWNFSGGGFQQTFSQNASEQLLVNLGAGFVGQARGWIGVIGQMKLTLNGNVVADTSGPWGNGALQLIPGTTPATTFNYTGTLTTGTVNLGFWLPGTWDGNNGLANGYWWAVWTAAVPKAPGGLKVKHC